MDIIKAIREYRRKKRIEELKQDIHLLTMDYNRFKNLQGTLSYTDYLLNQDMLKDIMVSVSRAYVELWKLSPELKPKESDDVPTDAISKIAMG